MTRRRSKAKRSSFGRVIEVLADLALVLLILAFGISIAARFNPEKKETTEAARPRAQTTPAATRPGNDPAAVRPAETDVAAPARARMTVDVRNGCGRVGLAEEMMLRLRRAGYDVTDCRNADRHDYAKTQVRDLRGNPQAAGLRDWLRREYGVGDLVAGTGAGADVQVVLGNDLADTLRRRERAGH